METIIASIITGAITLCGVLIANSKNQAVMETKVDALTREVREHNHFARRMPVVEEQIKVITLPESLTIKELADKMKIQPSAIVKKLFMQGLYLI